MVSFPLMYLCIAQFTRSELYLTNYAAATELMLEGMMPQDAQGVPQADSRSYSQLPKICGAVHLNKPDCGCLDDCICKVLEL